MDIAMCWELEHHIIILNNESHVIINTKHVLLLNTIIDGSVIKLKILNLRKLN